MNKESDWEECLESNSSLPIQPDKAKAKSLIDTALGRVSYLEKQKLEENDANYIFEGYYSSALELLHALLFIEGYKVINHICLGHYLKDILKKENLFRLFDNCRFRRNSLLYYGRKMDLAGAKESIQKCQELIEELKKLLYLKIG